MLDYQTHLGIPYHLKGSYPSLLIHTGTHGDEWSVIEPVTRYLCSHYDTLPEFLFVPQVSPSAVFNKTRHNNRAKDLNRCFKKNSRDPEARSNMELTRQFAPFNLCISFHEDPQVNRFYFYDHGGMFKKTFPQLRKKLKKAGVSLFTGIDDLDDEILGHQVSQGYVSTPAGNRQTGMFSDWSIANNLIKKAIVPEIPGKVTQGDKNLIVEIVMDFILAKANLPQSIETSSDSLFANL